LVKGLLGMKTLKSGYVCQKDWPENCSVQGDGTGIVISKKKGVRETAFFEAFPAAPNDTFIRGEGVTIDEAEAQAFAILEKYLACPGHEFERKDERGTGVCKHCTIQISNALESTRECEYCKGSDASIIGDDDEYFCAKCYYTVDVMGKYYAAKNGALKAPEKESPENFWEHILYSMAGARAFIVMDSEGDLKGLNTGQISDEVGALSRHCHRTHTMIQDVVINYLINYAGGEEYARFYTQLKASQMMSDPSLNDAIAQYHYDVRLLIKDDGVSLEDATEVFSAQLNKMISEHAHHVILEGMHFHKQETKPEGLVRARTSKEKQEGLKSALSSMFAALSKPDVDEDDNNVK